MNTYSLTHSLTRSSTHYKVLPGITFTAKTVLDVNIYPENSPIPDTMIGKIPSKAQGSSTSSVGAAPLVRNVFPRPYALTKLPHRDITMQNVLGKGDFDHYQVLTHLLTHLLTHSLTHLLTHLLTHSLTHLLTHSLTYLLTHSLTHSLTCRVSGAFNHYLIALQMVVTQLV